MGFLGNRRYDTTIKVQNVEIQEGGNVILPEGTTINNVSVTNIVGPSAAASLIEAGSGSNSIVQITNQTNFASGDSSLSFGDNNYSSTYGETVIGINSTVITGNATTFVATDPIFRVGNGASTGARSDAFRVYKNGSSYFKPVTEASIGSPTAGQVIFDSGTSSLKFYSGSAWIDTNPTSASSLWEVGSAADSIQQKDTNAVASGIRSFAVGNGVTTDGSLASGTDSVAFAGGEASGLRSFAHGTASTASGIAAVSFGGVASGGSSFSIFGTASGFGSVALSNGQAIADSSLAVGNQSRAETFSETVIGTFPTVITGNTTGITTTDPVFRVGNGTDILSRSDAFRVYKNGSFYMKPVTQASITSPVVGQLIWNSLTDQINLFNGLTWTPASGTKTYRVRITSNTGLGFPLYENTLGGTVTVNAQDHTSGSYTLDVTSPGLFTSNKTFATATYAGGYSNDITPIRTVHVDTNTITLTWKAYYDGGLGKQFFINLEILVYP